MQGSQDPLSTRTVAAASTLSGGTAPVLGGHAPSTADVASAAEAQPSERNSTLRWLLKTPKYFHTGREVIARVEPISSEANWVFDELSLDRKKTWAIGRWRPPKSNSDQEGSTILKPNHLLVSDGLSRYMLRRTAKGEIVLMQIPNPEWDKSALLILTYGHRWRPNQKEVDHKPVAFSEQFPESWFGADECMNTLAEQLRLCTDSMNPDHDGVQSCPHLPVGAEDRTGIWHPISGGADDPPNFEVKIWKDTSLGTPSSTSRGADDDNLTSTQIASDIREMGYSRRTYTDGLPKDLASELSTIEATKPHMDPSTVQSALGDKNQAVREDVSALPGTESPAFNYNVICRFDEGAGSDDLIDLLGLEKTRTRAVLEQELSSDNTICYSGFMISDGQKSYLLDRRKTTVYRLHNGSFSKASIGSQNSWDQLGSGGERPTRRKQKIPETLIGKLKIFTDDVGRGCVDTTQTSEGTLHPFAFDAKTKSPSRVNDLLRRGEHDKVQDTSIHLTAENCLSGRKGGLKPSADTVGTALKGICLASFLFQEQEQKGIQPTGESTTYTQFL